MDHLPIFLRVRGERALIVGGGSVAARKAQLLLAAGARVSLLAPQLGEEAEALVRAHSDTVRHIAASFTAELLQGIVLVIAATDRPEVNEQVSRAARERNLPVNVVDDAERSSFIVPAIVDRSPVVVAIGTGGASPVLARQLRAQLESLLPSRLGALARFAGRRRALVREALPASRRRAFWERLFSGPVARELLRGEETAAQAAFTRELAEFRNTGAPPRGEVYLIGAGPGDPDLLTLRAVQLLQQADVILYDRLVAPEILERARRDAERIFVGKDAGGCRTSQERINELLVEHALRGRKVARLKGGDPFIFGRGGEEVQVLMRHGIAFSVVPGITAGLAAAAAAAVPLTQRELSQSVTFATGHFAEDDLLDWRALARPRHTVVFYMGVSQLESIVARLIAAGAPAERPAALIERASLPGQRTLRAPLAEIAARARTEAIAAPALLIVGEVTAVVETCALDALAGALQGAA
ncbi:MAG TPA: siroheme synthase CysG [Steroidobacteraceae bacterium]|nr:siroheme synthase CysG [Steroidobacteraceae bacterium]